MLSLDVVVLPDLPHELGVCHQLGGHGGGGNVEGGDDESALQDVPLSLLVGWLEPYQVLEEGGRGDHQPLTLPVQVIDVGAGPADHPDLVRPCDSLHAPDEHLCVETDHHSSSSRIACTYSTASTSSHLPL